MIIKYTYKEWNRFIVFSLSIRVIVWFVGVSYSFLWNIFRAFSSNVTLKSMESTLKLFQSSFKQKKPWKCLIGVSKKFLHSDKWHVSFQDTMKTLRKRWEPMINETYNQILYLE